MTKSTSRRLFLLLLAALAQSLVGCAAMIELGSNQELEIDSQVSDTIFLDAVDDDRRTIYVQVRNTSGHSFDVGPAVKQALQERGYRVTDKPKRAHFTLKANVRSIEKADRDYADRALRAGYSGKAGAELGFRGAGKSYGQRVSDASLLSTLFAFLDDFLSTAVVKVPVYTVITDVEVTQKITDGRIARVDRARNSTNGSNTRKQTTSSGVVDYDEFTARIVSTATQANLDLVDALPGLTSRLTNSLSNLF